MLPQIFKRLCNLLFLCLLIMETHAVAAPQILHLLGRSLADNYHARLSNDDQTWLKNRTSLRLGTARPNYPPFEMTRFGGDYEGITADYAYLISQLLHVNIVVHQYDNRSEALQALKEGKIDILGTANSYTATDSEILLSQPYVYDHTTMVARAEQTQPLDPHLTGKRIAMVYDYLPAALVGNAYPAAHLQLHPSTLSAIGAVAFGQADVYLGDSISANYIINNNYLANVQLADLPKLEENSFSFALSKKNIRLLNLINNTLENIPINEKMAILRRWNAVGMSINESTHLQLSESEQTWLKKNPHTKIIIKDDFVPLTFFDGSKFRGLSADVLTKISQRTGIKFDKVLATSVTDMITQIKIGQADMMVAVTPGPALASNLNITRSYLVSPFVLVSSTKAGSPNSLDDMAGKRLVLIQGTTNSELFAKRYPDINVINADNALQAMAMVSEGKADAAVNTLISAHYIISRQYTDQLQIKSTIGATGARVAFAVGQRSPQLLSILDKALASISPEEMDEISNRWHGEVIVSDSFWLKHRTTIIQAFTGAAALLLLAITWITHLRRNIRRRKMAELALHDQMEFMRVLIDGTPHPIYVRDRLGLLMHCNSAYLEAFGLRKEDVVGKTVIDGGFYKPDEAHTYHNEYLLMMSEGKPAIKDRILNLPTGESITIYHWMLPYRDRNNIIVGMIAGWIDVSERQRLLEQLRVAKESADDANRAKTTFLATMSHEIRTPMNAIIGMLELAMKKAEDEIFDRFAIEVASNAAQGLLELIGDILDIARIESGRLSLSPERANLRELVESVARVFEGLARQKHLQLLLHIDSSANQDVLIDPLRFKQIISNLLSNAIKFTAEGEVLLTVHSKPLTNKNMAIRVKVTDSGSGISIDDQLKLFAPFTQANNNGQSARSGSGLGLVISRTLCEMMGGTLELNSSLGKGTEIEIKIELPLLQSQNSLTLSYPEPQRLVQSMHILIIDDYPANRQLLAQQLTYLGHTVMEAENGADGFQAWCENAFDAVITDCSMPVMNGYELADAIRKAEQDLGLTRCLMLGFTANAQPEEKERCLAAGMDDCLFKPTSLKDLNTHLGTGNILSTTSTESFHMRSNYNLDLVGLKQLTRGDTASIQKLLKDLLTSNEQDLLKLSSVLAKTDISELTDLAHKIKGGARIIKAQNLIFACERLEEACEAKETAEHLTQGVLELKKAMLDLSNALSEVIANTKSSS